MKRKRIYIAGPMRGIPQYNFPAFDEAAEALYNVGWQPVNPADLDRDMGYEPDEFPADHDWTQVPEGFPLKTIVATDLAELVGCDAVYMLRGWESSKGAKAELAVAMWLGLEVIFQGEGTEFNIEPETEDILAEAMRLTTGDRQAQYGPPTQDFSRTAAMWSALFGHKFAPRDVATAMICLKLSRLAHQPKRDSWTDLAGYSRCGWICDGSP